MITFDQGNALFNDCDGFLTELSENDEAVLTGGKCGGSKRGGSKRGGKCGGSKRGGSKRGGKCGGSRSGSRSGGCTPVVTPVVTPVIYNYS